MQTKQSTDGYRVVATRCGSCGCGCPTILDTENADELVIVGKLNPNVSESAAVLKYVGPDEVAIVIPKSLLLEAAKALV